NENSTIQTWLYKIAINHCKDHIKSWHYRKVHVNQFIFSKIIGQEASPEQQYLKKSENDELLSSILKLPVKYREIILLYFFHDLTLKEISEVCQINLSTVKSRMSRGKEILKKTMLERRSYDGQPNSPGEKTTNERIS
ncbi:sigma-70 family RNA polymerase sigma factor, partial [Neobacillus niacini]|uniref:sigma-70 family RNA polymerase sigma factor n=1 Tax=Neobacillus niacini TaxID=86668 RepID=UPI00300362BA